jgi:DNA-binding FadR family transcriptional regulator
MTDRRSTNIGEHVDSPLVEAIARRVAELLRSELVPASRLLTPSEVAERFAVSRTWVYEHADELGAIRLGQGPKARIRFDAQRVRQVLSRPPATAVRQADGERRRAVKKGLLPIRGAEARET